MRKEIMHEDDVLNSDNIGSVLFNLSEISEDMEGLRLMLEPFNDINENELIPHIIRSLETFISDVDAIHGYLDRICLNSARCSETETDKEGRC